MLNRHDVTINYEKDSHNIKQSKEESSIFI